MVAMFHRIRAYKRHAWILHKVEVQIVGENIQISWEGSLTGSDDDDKNVNGPYNIDHRIDPRSRDADASQLGSAAAASPARVLDRSTHIKYLRHQSENCFLVPVVDPSNSGIVEQFRGAHLGIPLAEEMKRRARAAGATRYMTLGCMGDNWPAIKTYEKSGFSIAHECFSMEWNRPAAAAEQPRKPPGSGLTIADIDAHSLLIGAYDRLHQSSTPVWNRQRPSLEEMSGLRGLAVPSGPGCAVLADDCDSYVLFRPSTDVLSSSDGVVAILDLCGTVAGMTALLTELQRRYKQLAVNSESDHSPALPCLRQAGFTVSHQRLHMVASLGGSETVDDEAKLRDAVIRPRAKL